MPEFNIAANIADFIIEAANLPTYQRDNTGRLSWRFWAKFYFSNTIYSHLESANRQIALVIMFWIKFRRVSCIYKPEQTNCVVAVSGKNRNPAPHNAQSGFRVSLPFQQCWFERRITELLSWKTRYKSLILRVSRTQKQMNYRHLQWFPKLNLRGGLRPRVSARGFFWCWFILLTHLGP